MPHPTKPITDRASLDNDALHEALALQLQAIIREMNLPPDTIITDAHRRYIMQELEPYLRLIYGTSPEDTESGVYLLSTRAGHLGSLMPMQEMLEQFRAVFGDEAMAAADAEAVTEASANA